MNTQSRTDVEHLHFELSVREAYRQETVPDCSRRVLDRLHHRDHLDRQELRGPGGPPPSPAHPHITPHTTRHITPHTSTQDTSTPDTSTPDTATQDTATPSDARRRLAVAAQWLLAASAIVVVVLMWMASNHDQATLPEPERRPVAQDPKQERLRKDAMYKKARRWVTFLELDQRREEAVGALLKMGPDAVPALVKALEDPRPLMVQRVCQVLRALGPQAAAAKDKLLVLSNSKDQKLARAALYALAGLRPAEVTLVTDMHRGRVLELDKTGKVVRTLTGVRGPSDAERLPNGNYLICCYGDKKVVEMTPKGKVVWSFKRLNMPYKAQRLPNGNTLIAEGGGNRTRKVDNRVMEVTPAGKIVWKFQKAGIVAFDVERLPNGNTLIADGGAQRVIEVTRKGEIAWEHKLGEIVTDVDRLPNGNTLITVIHEGSASKTLEVNRKGKVVHELEHPGIVFDVDRLPNGHLLIASTREVAEFDAAGKKLWSTRASTHPAEVNRH